MYKQFYIVFKDAVDISITDFQLPGNLVKGEIRDFTLMIRADVPAGGEMGEHT